MDMSAQPAPVWGGGQTPVVHFKVYDRGLVDVTKINDCVRPADPAAGLCPLLYVSFEGFPLTTFVRIMNAITVAFNATEVYIPKKTAVIFFEVEFPNSTELARLDLRLTHLEGTEVLSSRLTSRPLGGPAVPRDELNRRLDQIHEMAFGPGRWLNIQ